MSLNRQDKELQDRIQMEQRVQKCNRMDSAEWQRASRRLAPLFVKAAQREKQGVFIQSP